MIRFIYWFLALIEVFLVLAVLVLFIITDSRTIKYIAETSLNSSGLSYENIEGNLFDGLKIRKLSYKNKPIFSSALIHWNPLSLFYEKITITKLDAQGIELENIIAMLNSIKSNTSDERNTLDFTLALNSMHFDINPYVYEGVKYSSFVFETSKIDVAKDLTVNVNMLYLKFDSDIVNVEMHAKIEDNQLVIDKLDLKNISAKDITTLTARLKSKDKEENQIVFFKDIKIKHIEGTMKAVQYGDLKIEGATLHLYDGLIEPSKNFIYQVKKVGFTGSTNFGKLDYKGYIRDSNIYAKGHITLDKKLFTKYSLPLNYKGLKKLPSSLRLNHDAVWIDIDHKVSKLLKIKNDFNLDVSKAKHKLHYDYNDEVFSIESDVNGKMTYANIFELKNKVIIDRKGFSYVGKALVLDSKVLPPLITDYLLPSIKGDYKGTTKDFEILLTSSFFDGIFQMKKYKSANFEFKSKSNNIALKKIIPAIPEVLRNELVGLEGKGILDFKNLKKSKVTLNMLSHTMDINAKMKLVKPYEIKFLTQIKNDSQLKKLDKKIKFSEIKNLNGTIELFPNRYLFKVSNEQLNFFLDYDISKSLINKGIFQIGNETFTFQKNYKNELSLNTRISNIQSFFKKIKRYYKIELPNIDGSVDLIIKQEANKKFKIVLKTPHLKYISSDKTTNIYNIETEFIVDDKVNVLIKTYKFRIDDNGYLNVFYSNNDSLLKFKNGELKIEKFWLNDKASIVGKYDLKNSKGNFKLEAENYGFNNKDFNLQLNLDLNLKVVAERLDISGDITIIGGTIRYEVIGKDIVEDADIIIIEEVSKAKKSPLRNLKLYIKIKSKKPLRYVAEDVNVEFFNELSIVKNFEQDMLVTGVSTISNGYYQLEDKRFILDKSHLYFTGDVKKPLLDIKANYEKEQYSVHIFISGTTDAPIVNFNSEPYLTQQEILSLILFDGTGSSSGKGAEAYTLLGGSFAKGLIKSLGIDVDHLLLGKDREDQLSLEVGRKISKDISVLYLHKDGLDGAKVRIEHSPSFETDIIIQPPNTSSIEFLYKQDR